MYELQLTNVNFEFDVKNVVDYFNKGSNDLSKYGAIIDKCRRSCNNSHFENFKVEFSWKQGNVVVQTLDWDVTFFN